MGVEVEAELGNIIFSRVRFFIVVLTKIMTSSGALSKELKILTPSLENADYA